MVDFAVPVNFDWKSKKTKRGDFARELKNLWNMKVTMIPVEIGALVTITKGLVKGLEDLERTGRDHPDFCIITIDQYTEKSSGDLRRLAVTQTTVKDQKNSHNSDNNNLRARETPPPKKY